MAAIVREAITGTLLSNFSRKQLTMWLLDSKTGSNRLRAGVPREWRVGDKTGSGGNNAMNDVAVLWPPERKPMIVAAYYVGAKASDAERDAVVAEVGRVAVAADA